MALRAEKISAEGTSDSHLSDIPYHAKSAEACIELLSTRLAGLNDKEVADRKVRFGKNTVSGSTKQLARKLFFYQFKNLTVILLMVAAGFAVVQHEWLNVFAIFVALVVNGCISFFTKWKARRSLLGLEAFSRPVCTVIRDGLSTQLEASEVVPGDILMVSAGQTIPADARLISSDDLQVDEAALTGESVLVTKDASSTHIVDEDLTEQTNMLFAGTIVKTGRGQAIVTNTGVRSQMGRIAALASSAHRRQSLMTKALIKLGIVIFIMVGALAAATAYLGYLHGDPLLDVLQIALVLLAAAVPEILPACATYILTLGIEELSHEKAIVRNLHAMEAIGSVTVLCTDKTGTLTENMLTVHQVYLPETGALDYDPQWSEAKAIPNRTVEELLRIGRLNNTTILDGVRSFMMGDPIDVALYRATPAEYEFGYDKLKDYPFDSQTMLMASVYKHQDGGFASMIKGAPEAVIAQCGYYLSPTGQVMEMTRERQTDFLLGNQDLALEGTLRVIGFAEKPMQSADEAPYGNAVFVGWVCLVDPAKPGVKQAIQQVQQSGIRVIMITGDQKATAAMVADDLGILVDGSEVWTRKDLDGGLKAVPLTVRVFARTQPEEKLGIVQALQASGDVVAMVGDGVNDAPALRKSDIAIAMGIRGAQAAKESADIVLLNDHFDTIATAVWVGRVLTNNVKLCVMYLLSCNIGLALLMLLAGVLEYGFPMNAIQLLWLNIATVSIPALSLAFEPGSEAMTKTPSRPYHQGILAKEQAFLIWYWALLMTACGLGAYFISRILFHQSHEVAGTMTFTTMALSQTLHLINIQAVHAGSNLKTFFSDLFAVPLTWMIVGIAIILQAGAVYLPFMNLILKTVPIQLTHLWVPISLALLPVLLSIIMIRPEKS